MPRALTALPRQADDAPLHGDPATHRRAGGEVAARPGPADDPLRLVVNAGDWRAGDILLCSRPMREDWPVDPARLHPIAAAQMLAGFAPPASDVIHVGLFDGAGHVWDVSLLRTPRAEAAGRMFEPAPRYALRRPPGPIGVLELAREIALVSRDFYTLNLVRLLRAVGRRIAARHGGLPPGYDVLHDPRAATMTLCTTWVLRCLSALDIEVLMDVEMPLPADFMDTADLDEAPLAFYRL